jgi:carbon storage regulator
MLVLARKSRESIVIGDAGSLQEVLRLKVIDVRSGIVKLGFDANRDVAIYREEVWDRLCAERETTSPKQGIQPTV